jgi:hypothetical protein
MTLGRSQQVSLEDTSYYQCISRCVGERTYAGKTLCRVKIMNTANRG